MLPERKKNLIIVVVGVILFILLVVSIFGISNYIKQKGNQEKDIDDRNNSPYPSEYLFYGVTQDLENIYRFYGINNNYIEKYIGVRSFYKVQDCINRDNKIVAYTDGINILQYDGINKEFYLYRFDDYYSNNISTKLAHDYLLVIDKEKNTKAIPYGKKEGNVIFNGIDVKDMYVYDNYVLYKEGNGIYLYDLNNNNSNSRKLINYSDSEEETIIEVLDLNDNYVAYYYNGSLSFYMFSSSNVKVADNLGLDSSIIKFLSLTKDGFYYQLDNENGTYTIRKYLFSTGNPAAEEYTTRFDVKKMIYLAKDIYYMEIKMNGNEESILFSTKEQDIVEKLENKYIYIYAVGK